jgi:hypothetical protein
MNTQTEEKLMIEKVSFEVYEHQPLAEIISDYDLEDASPVDVIDNKHIRGNIGVYIHVQRDGNRYKFDYQDQPGIDNVKNFCLLDDTDGDDNILRYLNDVYGIDGDHDDYAAKFFEISDRFIEPAEKAFNGKLKEIKLNLEVNRCETGAE